MQPLDPRSPSPVHRSIYYYYLPCSILRADWRTLSADLVPVQDVVASAIGTFNARADVIPLLFLWYSHVVLL